MRLLVGGFAAAILMVASVAEGFDPSLHQQILRATLRPGVDLDGAALATIVAANEDSDLHQADPRRHFDSARNPADICVLWAAGVETWLNEIVDLVQPQDAEKRTLKDREAALVGFGLITHAIQDFFTHSNYVELGLGSPSPGFLLASCRPQEFNPELQTGYFDMVSGADGCPETAGSVDGKAGMVPAPPMGFRFCHLQLNKDKAFRVGHPEAIALATQATRHAWEEVRRRIIAKYESDRTIDAECLFMKFAWGGDRSCHRMWLFEGKLTIRRPGPAPEFMGEVVFDGIKIHLEWAPTRYLGPLEPVMAPVRVEFRFNGPVRAAFSNPPRCRAEETRTRTATGTGTLMVSPDPDVMQVQLVAFWPGDAIQLKCSDPRANFSQDIDGFCLARRPTELLPRQDEREQTFEGCTSGFPVLEHITGKMKLDKP